MENEKSLLAGEANAKGLVLNLFEFDRPSHFQFLKLSDARADKVKHSFPCSNTDLFFLCVYF